MTTPADGSPRPPHVVVVGGGIAGLSAAWALLSAPNPPRVSVFEGSGRVGGKLALGRIAGIDVDLGAEAMLAARPAGVELAREVGLGDELETPAVAAAALWSRGGLHPLPARAVMGVPGDLVALGAVGVLTRAELSRARLDLVLPRRHLHDDVAVGPFVASRVGRAVVDRVVEPLLGGVYAGLADELSLESTIPALFAAMHSQRSLVRAAAALAPAPGPGPRPPVFAGVRGGVGRLATATAAAVARAGGAVRLGVTVRELNRRAQGWELVTGSRAEPRREPADAVVVALPPAAAARLLSPLVPALAGEYSAIPTASSALVVLAFSAHDPWVGRLSGSGLLVPAVDRRVVKGITYSGNKWAWSGAAAAAQGLVTLRASIGRFGEEAVLQRSDDELVALALADLNAAVGADTAPVESLVVRWGGGLPQYLVGHRARVTRIRAAVTVLPAVAVAGAAYDGVGIPAVVASGRLAARQVLAALHSGGEWPA